MRKIYFILFFTINSISLGNSAELLKYTSSKGNFIFDLPENWVLINQEHIDSFNTNRPETNQFEGGVVDTASIEPKVYMLLQVKYRPTEPKEKIDTYINSAIQTDDLSIIKDVIINKEYDKSEFYSPKYESFLLITQNGPQLSIMVKQFTDYGYNIMHFYLGNNISKNIMDIEYILSKTLAF